MTDTWCPMALRTLYILDAFEPDVPLWTGESTGTPRSLYAPSVLRVLADLRASATDLPWTLIDTESVVPLQPESISLR